MTSFKFTLNFRLAHGTGIQRQNSPATLSREKTGSELILHVNPVYPNEPNKSEKEALCTILGGPYSTRNEAITGALRAKEAILLWAVHEDVGINFDYFEFGDLTKEAKLAELSPSLNEAFLSMGAGIQIMDETTDLLNLLIHVIPDADRSSEEFAVEFREHHSDILRLTPKQIIAIQLFTSAVFITSVESRFISTISAVEALIDATTRESTDVVKGLKVLQNLVKTLPVDDLVKNRLIQKLENAKQLSIAKRGKHLVSSLLFNVTYDGKSPSKTFETLYNVRSKLLHEGHAGISTPEFQNLLKLCRSFV